MTNNDKVNKPNHYIGLYGLEVEEVLQNFIPKYADGYVAHRISSAIEYSLRSPEKNGLEDLKKARKNLDQAIMYWENKPERYNQEVIFKVDENDRVTGIVEREYGGYNILDKASTPS